MNLRPLCLVFAGLLLGCNARSSDPAPPAKPATDEPPRAALPATAIDPPAAAPPENGSASPPSIDPAPPAAAPPAWLADLASADADVRQRATEQLQQQPQPIGLLLDSLTQSEVDIRRGAAFGLLSEFDTRNAEQTAAMQQALADDDEMVRRVALQAVSQWSQADPVAAEGAVPTLEAIVRNPSRDTFERSQAVRILGRLGSAAQPALIRTFVHDADANVRKAALAAAMRTTPPTETIAPSLLKLLADDDNPALRRQAALHLKQYVLTVEVQQALAAAFNDTDSDVRLEAATSLAAAGPVALDFTLGLLDDTRPHVRLYAVFALGKMGSAAEPAVPRLRQLASDPDSNVAKTAAGVIRVIQASAP